MLNSNNTPTHFECEIDNLNYGIIERKIANYFDMGYPSSSDFPVVMEAEICGTYTLIGTKKNGRFSVSAYALKNDKYQLSVSLQGKLSKA